MAISKDAKVRIVGNITSTRALMLKNIPEIKTPGDYALTMLALAVTNIAEVMLESQEVKVIDEIPDGEVPIIGRGN